MPSSVIVAIGAFLAEGTIAAFLARMLITYAVSASGSKKPRGKS